MGNVRVLVVCLALVVPACEKPDAPSRPEAQRTSPTAVSPPGRWTTFTHPDQAWSWRYPPGWRVQTFETEGLASHEGALLSNVRHRFDYPDLRSGRETSAWDFRRVPSHAVVVELSQVIRLMHVCSNTTETPLSLGDSEVTRGAYGSPPRLWQSLCVRGQSSFGLHVWLGDEASPEDRAAVRKVVRSIRFREPLTSMTRRRPAAAEAQPPDTASQ